MIKEAGFLWPISQGESASLRFFLQSFFYRVSSLRFFCRVSSCSVSSCSVSVSGQWDFSGIL